MGRAEKVPLAPPLSSYLPVCDHTCPQNRRRRNGDRDGDETTRQLSDLRVVLKTFAKLISKPRILFIMILQALSSVPFIWGVTLLTVTLSNPLKVDQKSISGLIIVTTLVASAATILVSR